MNTFMLFEDSYQIDRIDTELNIKPHFAEYHLAKQFEYREGNYWAKIQVDGIETRYKIIDDVFTETKRFEMITKIK